MSSIKKGFIIGAGAAGNKALFACVSSGVVLKDDCCAINSTSKDLPLEFDGRIYIIKDESRERGGCGKECELANKLTLKNLKNGCIPLKGIINESYDHVVIITSGEGGTGNGVTQAISNYVAKVLKLPVHIIVFDGFHTDARGLRNFISLVKSLPRENSSLTIIRNSAYLTSRKNDYTDAEVKANQDLALKLSILLGNCIPQNEDNIDDTDIYKLEIKPGYKVVEYMDLEERILKGEEDYADVIHEMISNSSAMETDPSNRSIAGLIANLPKKEQGYINVANDELVETYGKPYELFSHIGWNEQFPRFVAFIYAGLPIPQNQIDNIYNQYQESMARIEEDDSWSAMDSLVLDKNEDKIFNTGRSVKRDFDEDAEKSFFDDMDDDDAEKSFFDDMDDDEEESNTEGKVRIPKEI